MVSFSKTDIFKSWNVGFVLDEGLANPGHEFLVFNGERSIRTLFIHFKGNAGHGSRFIKNSVGEKVTKFLQTVYEYRRQQELNLEAGGSCISLGEVSTCNLTGAHGGIAYNVVPAEFELTVDFRLATDVEISDFEAMLDDWVKQSGDDVCWRYRTPNAVLKEHSKSELNADTNPFWRSFISACDKLEIETKVRIFPAAADSRHLRHMGYDCIGFSPINNTPVLLHDHDEFLNKDVYLRGIEIYEEIIKSLSSC
ncbi:aminoacylase-1A-like [Symsagittifera roscoffensis]|uniref:aminoacylase-1A-like n=1 Tax=Symsagittifera roscoffensis TaxID=84072 RepID=UPI00307BD67E